MSTPAGSPREPALWRLKLRLLHRAWRYRWRTDPAEIAFARAHALPGTLALDIGAHKGGYTFWLARSVGATGRVYAFEPQPMLAANLRRCFDPARVVVENAGVSDRNGTMELHIPGDGAPSPGASLEPIPAVTATGHSLSVRVIALDGYLQDRRLPVSFVKCDVEGHELHVFRGAGRLLRSDRPVLLFECEQRHHGAQPITAVFAYLEDLGYTGRFYCRRQLLPLAAFDPAEHQNPDRPAAYCNNFVFTASPA